MIKLTSSGKIINDTPTSECPPSNKTQEYQKALRKGITVRILTKWLNKEDEKATMENEPQDLTELDHTQEQNVQRK